jgi:aryl-alcohol dehydrogenase-like predicted oxidoreductase
VAETLLGKALGKHRRDVVLGSKVFNPMGPGPNDSGASRAHLMRAVEDSLRRLGTDYLDLYYLHHVDVQTPLEETLRALDDLVRQGKVLYPAVSNFEVWRLMEALWLSDRHDWSRFVCYQPQYSLVVRDIEEEIVPACDLKGLGVVAWSPLGGGFLTGKYRPGQYRVEGARSAEGWSLPERYFHAERDRILAALSTEAQSLGRSAAQVALRWVLDRPFISSAIVGARSAAQVAELLGARGWRLPDDVRTRLSTVSQLPPRYPRAMEADMAQRRDAAVKR